LKKSGRIGLILAVLAFIAACILAFALESIGFIYIASALPIAIVWLLPNTRPSQWLRTGAGKGKNRALIYRIQGYEPSESDLLIISFENGTVNWNKHVLYFSLDRVPIQPAGQHQDELNVTLPVLRHDLHLHPRKRKWIGIELQALAERSQHLACTTQEINRFAIRVADLANVAGKRKARASQSSKPSLQA